MDKILSLSKLQAFITECNVEGHSFTKDDLFKIIDCLYTYSEKNITGRKFISICVAVIDNYSENH